MKIIIIIVRTFPRGKTNPIFLQCKSSLNSSAAGVIKRRRYAVHIPGTFSVSRPGPAAVPAPGAVSPASIPVPVVFFGPFVRRATL